jgi:methylenetetrahydrofolate reductase (NADPH)
MPDSVVARIEAAADPVTEGFDICVEQIRELQNIPGVSGVNIMATTDLAQIPKVVDAAGLR